MSEVSIPVNPGRVLFGLSRIGYTPSSAICDIADNAVVAGAKNVWVKISKENSRYADTRPGNVKEYLIIDDGEGMDEATLKRALELGSTDQFYGADTLSKFGLGLKSATFSQGDTLELISGQQGNFLKYKVSLPEVMSRGEYFATTEALTESELNIIATHLTDGHGTIVRIGDVRKEGHPSIKHTVYELGKKVGVIYYYFMKDDGLKVFIDDVEIQPYDALFTEQAESNGNLDENDWNGREVRWIEKPKTIVLDGTANVSATIEVTQLPHPPTFTADGRGEDKKIRDTYNIEAGNYGFYVYRNKRLISWADGFNGIIGYDQDLYSFRGRILIDDSADEAFNIDVKKSSITLSEEAWQAISDKSLDYKRKSKHAWNKAKALKKERENEEPNQQSNQIANEFVVPTSLPGLTPVDDDVATEVETEIEKASKQRVEKSKKQVAEDLKASGGTTTNNDGDSGATEEEIEETALKGEVNPNATHIFRVPYTEDNCLWEPYFDAEHGHCVRINKGHRFARVLFEDNQLNADLQVLFELFLHQLAISEVESTKQLKQELDKIDLKTIQRILAEGRRVSSEFLAQMCRKLEGKLPPL